MVLAGILLSAISSLLIGLLSGILIGRRIRTALPQQRHGAMVTDLAPPSDELLSTGPNGTPTQPAIVGPGRGDEISAEERVVDESTARQLEAFRQDFVANVSHELK